MCRVCITGDVVHSVTRFREMLIFQSTLCKFLRVCLIFGKIWNQPTLPKSLCFWVFFIVVPIYLKMLNDECIPNSDREIKENCSKSICTKFMTEIKVFSVIKINGCKV